MRIIPSGDKDKREYVVGKTTIRVVSRFNGEARFEDKLHKIILKKILAEAREEFKNTVLTDGSMI